jgi:hypothetical protein
MIQELATFGAVHLDVTNLDRFPSESLYWHEGAQCDCRVYRNGHR